MEKGRRFGIPFNAVTHTKLHFIERYEGCSGNGQILYLIRQCISDFEEAHGEIPFETAEGHFLPRSGGARGVRSWFFCFRIFCL